MMDYRAKRKLGLCILFSTAFFLWLFFNHASPWTRKVVSDIVGTSGALIAACWAFQGVFKRGKRLWGADLIAAYLLLYSIGMGCWTYLELVKRQEAPFPSLADAFY